MANIFPCMRGFTIIEILVSLVILILLSVMIIPSQGIFINKTKNELLGEELLNALRLARNAAITHDAKVVLCPSVDQISCSGNWENGFLIRVEEKNILIFQEHINGRLNLRIFPKTANQLEFLPEGTTAAQNGTFWFCPNSHKKPSWVIVLNKGGRPRFIKPDRNGDIFDGDGKLFVC